MEKNFKLEKVMMCDRCRCLFVATKNQLKHLTNNVFFLCYRCEKEQELDKLGQDSYRRGRNI